MFRAAVPKATINKHCDTNSGEDDVGSYATSLPHWEQIVLAKSQASAMEFSSHGNFRFGVGSLVPSHRRTDS